MFIYSYILPEISEHIKCVYHFLHPKWYNFFPLSPFHLAIYRKYLSVSECILPRLFEHLIALFNQSPFSGCLQCCLNLCVYISLHVVGLHFWYIFNFVKIFVEICFLSCYISIYEIVSVLPLGLQNIKYLLFDTL